MILALVTRAEEPHREVICQSARWKQTHYATLATTDISLEPTEVPMIF
jgi:hypothetical protein